MAVRPLTDFRASSKRYLDPVVQHVERPVPCFTREGVADREQCLPRGWTGEAGEEREREEASEKCAHEKPG